MCGHYGDLEANLRRFCRNNKISIIVFLAGVLNSRITMIQYSSKCQCDIVVLQIIIINNNNDE